MRIREWRNGSYVVLALVLVGVYGCPAEEPAPPPPPPPAVEPTPEPAPAELPAGVTPEMVTQGQQIFTSTGNCYTCHGPDGSGTPLGPNLRDGRWINVERGDFTELVTVTRTGVTTPVEYPAPMPAMGGAQLTDDQVNAVAAYVWTISRGN